MKLRESLFARAVAIVDGFTVIVCGAAGALLAGNSDKLLAEVEKDLT